MRGRARRRPDATSGMGISQRYLRNEPGIREARRQLDPLCDGLLLHLSRRLQALTWLPEFNVALFALLVHWRLREALEGKSCHQKNAAQRTCSSDKAIGTPGMQRSRKPECVEILAVVTSGGLPAYLTVPVLLGIAEEDIEWPIVACIPCSSTCAANHWWRAATSLGSRLRYRIVAPSGTGA